MLFGKPKSTAEKLKALGEAYGAALPAKLQELETAARALSGGGSFEELTQSLHDARALAHKIAGTAGTFGYQAITDQARNIEKALRVAIDAGQPFTADQAVGIESQIAALKALGPAMPDPARGIETPSGAASARVGQAPSVLLLAPPGEDTDSLAGQIERHGYRVRVVSDVADKDNGGGEARAEAILLHTAMPQGHKICRRLKEELQREFRSDAPIIFLSEPGDFHSRLRAVRAGASAFVTAPLEASAIVRKIRELSGPMVFAPYRILVVEDDDMLALQCANAFEGPGYAARIVKDPADLLDRLETFDTELIVMDLSLSGVDGLELAKIVWQHDDHRDIAILFLSPGPEFNMQLLQIGVPDDFFLPRPVDVHALCALAARYLAETRSGRRSANFTDLMPHLDRIAALKSSKDKPRRRGDADNSGTAGRDAMRVAPPSVLVVDDDRHLVDAMAIKLSEHGFEVLTAFSGEQGFRVAWEEHPDVIITDYAMPDGSGDYLLGRLKDVEDTRDIPVMVLTAHTLDGHKDYALEREFVGRLGAVTYLAKPISLDTLVAEVTRFVSLPSHGSP